MPAIRAEVRLQEGGMRSRDSHSAWRRLGGLLAVGALIAGCATSGAPSPAAVATVAATPVPATPVVTEVPPDQLTGALQVLEWGGYEATDFWTDFQAKYPKVDVSFIFGDTDASIYSQMKAGSQADLFHQYTGWIQFDVNEGLAAEIDTTKLTNWSKVPPAFQKIGQYNGKQYCVAWDWGFTSIP